MYVGGEFYEDDRWVVDTPTLSTEGMYFFNGGRACLTVIANALRENQVNHILLPSYLCPSILDVLDQCELTYDFYQVNEDFSIDLEDLIARAEDCRAIYFINYFGFQHSAKTKSLFLSLQQKKKFLIEDNAQSGFVSDSIGDFVFNSMRKFGAFDGGYMATRNKITYFLNKYPYRLNNRLPVIREYRSRLSAYLFKRQGQRSDLDNLFHQAEEFYEQDGVVFGDPLEREKIEHQDWQAIKAIRRDHYEYLLTLLTSIPGITPIYPTLQADNMPLGLPVYISNISRDRLNEALAEESISLSIHWDALLDDPRTNTNPITVKMAGNILTLPIDQYTSRSQLNYLARNLETMMTHFRTE